MRPGLFLPVYSRVRSTRSHDIAEVIRPALTRTPIIVAAALTLSISAMWCYPGGTALDHKSTGYSLTQNFLSDLGMTVAYNGASNALGALLFVLSVLASVIGLGGAILGFVRLCAQTPQARRWAWSAATIGLLACLAFVGVAATPENHAMPLHVRFTLVAFRALPLAALCLTVAATQSRAAQSPAAQTRDVMALSVMTCVLALYAVDMTWGPSVATLDGLRIQVIAQKVVSIVIGAVTMYLSVRAELLSARIAREP